MKAPVFKFFVFFFFPRLGSSGQASPLAVHSFFCVFDIFGFFLLRCDSGNKQHLLKF